MTKKRWTTDHDDALCELWTDPRLSRAEIAARLGFSLVAIGRASQRMGLPRRPGPAFEGDPEELRRLWQDPDIPIAHIALILAASISRLQRIAAVMGLEPRADQRPGRIDPARLRALWPCEDMTVQQIGDEMGVSHVVVARAARKLGLVERTRGKKRGKKRGTAFRDTVDRAAFKTAWHDMSLTVDDLADRFGVSVSTICDAGPYLGLPDRHMLRRQARDPAPVLRAVQRPVLQAAPHPKPGLCARPKLPELEARPADADILASKGRYSKMAEVADRHGLRPAEVQRRFHQLRAAGVTSGEGGRA